MNARESSAGVLIRDMTAEDLDHVARLHRQGFGGYFLTNLGTAFLKRYYAQFLGSPKSYAVAACDSSGVIGFCVGTQDKPTFFRRLYRKHFASTAILVAFGAIGNPVIRRGVLRRLDHIGQAFRARFGREQPKPSELNTVHHVPARLLSIAVADEHRGTGLAEHLVEQFCARLRAVGVTEVELTVATSNKRAIAFYVKTGWQEVFSDQSRCRFRRSTEPRTGSTRSPAG
jgi:ribosomal protein S18 acetylase RimI-like enzyme